MSKDASDWTPGTPGLTIGQIFGPAMAITDASEAAAYFERLVQHTLESPESPIKDVEDARAVVRSNLGYYAGYYDHETRERVERLYRCAHPVFGSIAEKGPPTVDEAYTSGLVLGMRSAMMAALEVLGSLPQGATSTEREVEATKILRRSLGVES